MKILAKALGNDTEFNLDLELIAGATGLDREIDIPRVQKQGLALTGYLESIQPHRVQVLGRTEIGYLETLSSKTKRAAIDGLVGANIPCAVVTSGLDVPPYLIEAANDASVPLFRTPLQTNIFISRVQDFLDEHLSPEASLHGGLIEVFGVGVMIIGQSGIGKSEAALDLVLRGHRLVADDVVVVKQNHGLLIGTGSPLTRHHMEVRGLGIISVKELFGAASVCERKQINLVVELLEWQSDVEADRIGIDDLQQEILGVACSKVRLPLRPGRNVAAIIEVAARNHLLKAQGHHAARKLQEKLEQRLAETAIDSPAGTD